MNKFFLSFFLILLVLVLISCVPKQSILSTCTIDKNGDTVCITLSKNLLPAQAIGVSPESPKEGEEFTVTLQISIPCFTQPISTAKLHLQTTGVTPPVDTWDIIEVIGTEGCYNTWLSTTFTAPSTGDYILLASIWAPNNAQYQETRAFSVGSDSCPANFCSSWTRIIDYDNGKVESKECTTFGNPPACIQSVDFQYKTTCDSGYFAKGFSSNIGDTTAACVECNQDSDCSGDLKCMNNECKSTADIFSCSGRNILKNGALFTECIEGKECKITNNVWSCISVEEPPVTPPVVPPLKCSDYNTESECGLAGCKWSWSLTYLQKVCSGIPAVIPAKCGDGIVDSGEECDDGNNVNEDGCSSDCKTEDIDGAKFSLTYNELEEATDREVKNSECSVDGECKSRTGYRTDCKLNQKVLSRLPQKWEFTREGICIAEPLKEESEICETIAEANLVSITDNECISGFFNIIGIIVIFFIVIKIIPSSGKK